MTEKTFDEEYPLEDLSTIVVTWQGVIKAGPAKKFIGPDFYPEFLLEKYVSFLY